MLKKGLQVHLYPVHGYKFQTSIALNIIQACLSNTLNELRVDACIHLTTKWFSEVLEVIMLHSRLPYFKMVMTD